MVPRIVRLLRYFENFRCASRFEKYGSFVCKNGPNRSFQSRSKVFSFLSSPYCPPLSISWRWDLNQPLPLHYHCSTINHTHAHTLTHWRTLSHSQCRQRWLCDRQRKCVLTLEYAHTERQRKSICQWHPWTFIYWCYLLCIDVNL